MTDSGSAIDLSGAAVILGAGFSMASGLPPAAELSKHFLTFGGATPTTVQRIISDNLRAYWRDIFGYEDGDLVPTFEDHFTLLDLAANAGHNIGHDYTPARLRALRRISIHRVFEIIDTFYRPSPEIKSFLSALATRAGSIVSLNWDIVVEKHLASLTCPYTYMIPGKFLSGNEPDPHAFQLIKLHGSANWHYCDACHRTQFGAYDGGKTTLHYYTFLEEGDREHLRDGDRLFAELRHDPVPRVECQFCGNKKTTARVATFSYAKAFDFFPFHASWDTALERLRAAANWVFIGYSLPEADYAFKHLLKTAQHASGPSEPKSISVITKHEPTDTDPEGQVIARYRQLFGSRLSCCWLDGFENWARRYLR
jgi:hypothetical protein